MAGCHRGDAGGFAAGMRNHPLNTMKTHSIFTPPTREKDSPRGRAIPAALPLPAAATTATRRFSPLHDMSCHGSQLVNLELRLQDVRDDARLEQDERGVRGLARLFSAASVRVLRIEIATLLLGFPLPRRSMKPRLWLLDWLGGYLRPPHPPFPDTAPPSSAPRLHNCSCGPEKPTLPLW